MTPSSPVAQDVARCSIPCDLCGSTDVEEICAVDRHGGDLRTVICRRCGLVWTDPRPSAAAVRDYYVDGYRLELRGARQPRRNLVYRAANGAIDRYRNLKPILTPGCRVLDIGAGSGEFVYVLRAAGYDASGIEPDDGYASFAAQSLNAPVSHGFYQDVQVPETSQDVVTMFHVLEHLESPFDALTRARQWLAPGGRLLVEVPNFEARCLFPRARYQRAHFHNFNGPALEMLGRKAGYTVLSSAVLIRRRDPGGHFREVRHGCQSLGRNPRQLRAPAIDSSSPHGMAAPAQSLPVRSSLPAAGGAGRRVLERKKGLTQGAPGRLDCQHLARCKVVRRIGRDRRTRPADYTCRHDQIGHSAGSGAARSRAARSRGAGRNEGRAAAAARPPAVHAVPRVWRLHHRLDAARRRARRRRRHGRDLRGHQRSARRWGSSPSATIPAFSSTASGRCSTGSRSRR